MVKPVTGLRAPAPVTPAAVTESADETPDYVPPGRQETRLDTSWHLRYLEILEESGGQKCVASKAAGVSLKTLAKHRKMLPAFEQAELDVLKLSLTFAESEAIRRATDGVESIYRRIVKDKDGTETVHEHVEIKYSDTLLLRLLTRLESGTWRDSKVVEANTTMTFKTRAERKAALEQARAATKQTPVTALNGRS